MPQLYYPRAAHAPVSGIIHSHLPARPDSIGPVLDASSTKVPLPVFDPSKHVNIYPGQAENGEALAPCLPDVVADTYLCPSLSPDERLRLTTLWYYTRGIEQDEDLLSSIDVSVKTLQKAIGWEFAIAGILDEATYTRLATANLPIAILPRRESTCSHTILQNPGTVFMVTDMSSDWRFKRSPHVEVGGLRSYAGTQLKFTTEDGQQISLGSLCVASNTVQAPLLPDDQTMLIRCAEQIVFQITNRARRLRLRERQSMSDVISALRGYTSTEELEALAILKIRAIFPGCTVSFQDVLHQTVSLRNGSKVPIAAFVDGIWENAEVIDTAIKSTNYERFRTEHAVRALIARCGSLHRYLVVDSNNVQHVFDDFDAWFVERCANVLSETLQTQQLTLALEANENFLRGMTHQLRTPLHGILGSVDLLAEDLISRSPASITASQDATASDVRNFPMTYVSTIRSAGKELMMTINNIIKLNRLADFDVTLVETEGYDLRDLESEIVERVLDLTSEQQLANLSLRVEHNLSADQCIIMTDVRRFKDCLELLLMNAVQAVANIGGGVVKMIIHASGNSKVQIDIVDTGCGIKPKDHDRIFEAFEKVDHHKPGAGVGLTLARKIAQRLHGSVELIASEESKGSTFRATFTLPITASRRERQMTATNLKHVPRVFCQLQRKDKLDHMFKHLALHLIQRGFKEDSKPGSGIIISDLSPDSSQFAGQFHNLTDNTVVLTYVPSQHGQRTVRVSDRVAVIKLGGAFCTGRLDDYLKRADHLFEEISEQSSVSSIKPQTLTSPISPLVSCTEALDLRRETMSPQSLISVDVPSPTIIAEPVASEPPLPSQVRQPRQVKALLVDDNAINLRILRLFCSKRSIPYVTAVNGNQAIHQYTESVRLLYKGPSLPCYCASCHGQSAFVNGYSSPDPHLPVDIQPISLVLMDLQMPECNGIEATRAIRRLEQEFGLPPSIVLMVTGQDSLQDRRDALSAGADEYLVKPVGIAVLEPRIRKYFGEHALNHQTVAPTVPALTNKQ